MCAYPLLPPQPCSVPEAAARPAGWIVLDARDEAAFARGHLPGAGRMTIPEYALRRAELPPREAHVLVVHESESDAREAAEALAALNYRAVRWLAAPLAALAGGLTDTAPAALLWRPSEFLERIVPRLAPGRALDLACGSSREGVHLALRGWQVDAWDHDDIALARANAFAARHGVALATRKVDLEAGPVPPGEDWDLVMVFRFLYRPLLPWIAQAVRPGGSLVYETFRAGQEVFGHPRHPRFLLQSGELAAAFPGWSSEAAEDTAPEGGPYMTRLWLRRPL
jgi:SAM-dependent methyltransferase